MCIDFSKRKIPWMLIRGVLVYLLLQNVINLLCNRDQVSFDVFLVDFGC